MLQNMKVTQQVVSCRIHAFWYNVMSKYMWCYGELSACIMYITHIYMYTPYIHRVCQKNVYTI